MRRRNLAWSAGPEGPDDLCLKLRFEPLDWNLSLEVGIWAQRREYSYLIGIWAWKLRNEPWTRICALRLENGISA